MKQWVSWGQRNQLGTCSDSPRSKTIWPSSRGNRCQHTRAPLKRWKWSDLTLWWEGEEKEEPNVVTMGTFLLAVRATSSHWPRPGPSPLRAHSDLIFTVPWGGSYYYPHSRIQETQERVKSFASTPPEWHFKESSRGLGRDEVIFAQTEFKLPIWGKPGLELWFDVSLLDGNSLCFLHEYTT